MAGSRLALDPSTTVADPADLAAVTATAGPAAKLALETLANASLLERTARGRYRMHPLAPRRRAACAR